MFRGLWKYLSTSRPSQLTVRRARPALEVLEGRDVPATLRPGFAETVVASGINRATAMEFAPDGKLFVASQGGTMQVWQDGSQLQLNFFADTPLLTDTFSERGLLGITFHPDYLNNHFVYVYYTTRSADHHNRVSRFTANAAGDLALAGSEHIIWEGHPHSAGNHNGGAIHFGPDGKLYIATGDNANGANSQNLLSLHGKILRLEPDGSIPADNPFVHPTAGRLPTWALGLRNPFTFAFQPGTNRMFINDVGQATWEEINVGVAGANYGWPRTEGRTGTPPASPGTYRAPLYTYNHGGAAPNGSAITGGVFYNPETNTFGSAYLGDYFFADIGGGWIYRLNYNPSTGQFLSPVLFASNIVTPVDLEVDDAGNLYYLSYAEGKVYQIVPFPPPTITQPPTPLVVTRGRPATFTVLASGEALQYRWQRADSATPNRWVTILGATSASFTIQSTRAVHHRDRFRVIVANNGGRVVSAPVRLLVIPNRAPVLTITVTTGLRDGKFDAGVPIAFTGTAIDPEDGPLDVSGLNWQVDYLTSITRRDVDRDGLPGLTRPFVPLFGGVADGTFTPATTGPYTRTDVAYVIRLTVADSDGGRTTQRLVIAPNTSLITLQTDPGRLGLTSNGQPVTAPNTFRSVVGFVRSIGAPLTQTLGTVSYEFVSWSDGGEPTHDIATPVTDTIYTARYRAVSVSGPIRVEAERLTRNGYRVVNNRSASAGRMISLRRRVRSGTASLAFHGPDGFYQVVIGYFDENDGVAQLALRLEGTQVHAWSLNRNRRTPYANAQARTRRVVGTFHISQGDLIEIVGTAHRFEYARVDNLIFIPVTSAPTSEI